ncbi:MAG: triose-phosphate isomerase [Firmicutes bacterium]|jgi:triose-phosphate isomerase|nr:triose-phosphate isomerase [Bacillota bacterium]
MRKPIIAGNWKMNKTNAEAEALINELKPLVARARAEVVVCVPYTDLTTVGKLIEGTKIHLGAQNVSWADKGAFTGEISADMLKELGVEYVIIGHSERRQYFGETDESVNKRVKQALAKGLKPIVCVGETLVEREKNRTKRVLKKQIVEGLAGIEDFTDVVIAYEPVWAIGTGKTATKEDANLTIGYIRRVVSQTFGKEISKNLRIQYGGSMNPGNAKELMSMRNVDGGLIGGASLKAEDFAKVVNYHLN